MNHPKPQAPNTLSITAELLTTFVRHGDSRISDRDSASNVLTLLTQSDCLSKLILNTTESSFDIKKENCALK